MASNRIALVYFSAMKEALLELGCEARLLNVTSRAARQVPLPLDDHEAFIFGFPVFANFAPSVICRWLPGLKGQGARCAQFLTYGARTAGHAHFHTQQLLERAGFRVLFTAEFVGRQTAGETGQKRTGVFLGLAR